jgi:hypothetical protein
LNSSKRDDRLDACSHISAEELLVTHLERRLTFTVLVLALVCRSVTGETPLQQSAVDDRPPFTDYCEMLAQEIQGRKHAFLAGNLAYYVGGRHHCWKPHEEETLGLTHPFHHDLRGRGFGLVEHEGSGYGHDFRGWEFYDKIRVAYGTVIIDGKPHPHPVPTSMQWRPERVICAYEVGGVRLR